MTNANNYCVAVIGAGPAGLFAAKELAEQGIHVFLLNRDIKPGGLAEYGIYPDKEKLKAGLRKQFTAIIDMPGVEYFGNLTVGETGDVKLSELRTMGFDGFIVAAGAQGTKWLGLPGESNKGVYHAKDLVYHFNKLPPFSTKEFDFGKHAAIIGVGNVMVDIARFLIYEKHVESVTAFARRGPGEVKFTRKELAYVVRNLDMDDFTKEIERVTPQMLKNDQNPDVIQRFVRDALDHAAESNSDSKLSIRFLSSVKKILGDEDGRMIGLEIEDNDLVNKNGVLKSVGSGKTQKIKMDSVIFAIGDTVDPDFGLPVQWNAFVKNPQPLYSEDGVSYESYDPEINKNVEGVFLAGWSRSASDGLVGLAKKDGRNAVASLLQYLHSNGKATTKDLESIRNQILNLNANTVTELDLKTLEHEEQRIADERGLLSYKFATNAEMLAVIHQRLG